MKDLREKKGGKGYDSRSSAASWVPHTLGSVVFFVSGMLCLVKARSVNETSVHAQTEREDNGGGFGGAANLVMALVSATVSLVALGVLFASGSTPAIYREFTRLTAGGISTRTVLPWVVAFGVLFFVGNLLFFEGLVRAPNAGYARAVMSVEVVLMTVLTALLFGSQLSWQAFLGVVIVVTGIITVSLA